MIISIVVTSLLRVVKLDKPNSTIRVVKQLLNFRVTAVIIVVK